MAVHSAEAVFNAPNPSSEKESQTRMLEFYNELPTTPIELALIQDELNLLMDHITDLPWAYLDRSNSKLLDQLSMLSVASLYLEEAKREQLSAEYLRERFGRPQDEILLEALPVFIELGVNVLSSQEIAQLIGREARRLMDETYELLGEAMLALETQEASLKQKHGQLEDTQAAVQTVDTKGYGEMEKEKQLGEQKLQVKSDETKKKAEKLRLANDEIQRGGRRLAISGTIFSQAEKQRVELNPIEAIAA
jgi:hypothetical protein